jgi:CRISPR-associated protein Cas4
MEMNITGTHFNYYQICKRKLWLFANGISMEHTSDLVYEGKLIHEESYPQRSAKYEEVEMDGIKVDYYDTLHKVIHEIKKSDKVEVAHEWQLKYYMYVFEQNGIEGISGILEYPVLRKRDTVLLSDIDRETIVEMINEIKQVIESDFCPPLEKKRICRNCSYWDFCYSGEEEE